MLRSVYYFLPPKLRYLVRRLYYLPTDLMKRRKPMEPPKGMIFTGGGNFIDDGEWFMKFFINKGGLRPDDAILDIGSGIGRIAIPLTKYLKGKYQGFDIVKKGVTWCKTNISAHYSNFKFDFFDLYNDLYKSRGIDSSNFEFPYPKNSFDMVVSISVFTHMLPNEVDNYFQETKKVLKDTGTLICTFFIVDDKRKGLISNNSNFLFNAMDENYYLMSKKVKHANVAYRKQFISEILQKNGLKISELYYGKWIKKNDELKTPIDCFQDIIIIKKATHSNS